MHPACSGCAAPCCVGRTVPLGDDELARLAAALGVAPDSFARAGALGRRDDGACVFAVAVDGSYRCGIEADKPRACRVYPYHVSVDEAGAWSAAIGHDAACPPAHAEAWAARVDGERATIEAAVAEQRRAEAHGGRARSLPVVAESPCFGCTTSCCLEYDVPVSAYDLWRLTRALGVPWQALVRVRPTPATWMESFTLDASGKKHALHLLRAADGACALLVTLPDGTRRCGVHAAHPLACRLYPYRGDWTPGMPVRLQADAVCPPPARDGWDAHRRSAIDDVAAEVAERQLYLRVLARWAEAARTRPPAEPFTVDDFLAWCFTVYQSVEKRLPTGRQIAVYQSVGSSLPTGRGNPDTGQARSIAELVATVPLPGGDAPGC